eukprot:3122890-Amphidinium_carterae.1
MHASGGASFIGILSGRVCRTVSVGQQAERVSESSDTIPTTTITNDFHFFGSLLLASIPHGQCYRLWHIALLLWAKHLEEHCECADLMPSLIVAKLTGKEDHFIKGIDVDTIAPALS